jgi:hypothetical protein
MLIAPALGLWWVAGRQRRWLRTTLVPAIEAAGYDPSEAPAVLQALDAPDGRRWPFARRLATSAAALRAILEEDGKWPSTPTGQD